MFITSSEEFLANILSTISAKKTNLGTKFFKRNRKRGIIDHNPPGLVVAVLSVKVIYWKH